MTAERTDYRRHLLESTERSQAAFDRTTITLAAGGLALSVSALKLFGLPSGLWATTTLVAAWLSWGTALGLSLYGLYLAPLDLDDALEQYDANVEPLKSKYKKRIQRMNKLALFATITGVFFLGGFSLIAVQ